MTDPRYKAGLDPARDSALLLQRIGFFTLGIALPVSAMLSRRAAVVLAPIGVALLVIAALLIEPERFTRSLRRRSVRATTLVLALLAFWTLLSLTWAPSDGQGADRAFNLLFALVLGLLGIAALPERVRAANLNALAVGAGLATVVAALALLTGFGASDAEAASVVRRGLATVVIMTGPLVAWLLSRGRTRGAAALFAVVALSTIISGAPALVAALVIGGIGFLGVVTLGPRVVTLAAALAAGLVLFAPLLGWIVPALLRPLGLEPELAAAYRSWATLIAASPVKLLTGQGFGALATERAGLALVSGLPQSVLVELWHELGLVGAAAVAVTLWSVIRMVRVLPSIMQAGAVSGYLTILALGVMGLANIRAWWLMTLVAMVVMTNAIARGQGRTDRPLARFVRPRVMPASQP